MAAKWIREKVRKYLPGRRDPEVTASEPDKEQVIQFCQRANG